MTRKANPDQRLSKARSAAAKELKLPADDWRVKRTAILHIAHENLTTALIGGARIDIGDLLKIEDALQAIRATLPPEQIKVSVEFIDGATGNRSTDIKELYPPKAKPAPTQIDGEVVGKPDAKQIAAPKVEASTPAAPPPPPPPPKPVVNPTMAAWERQRGYAAHSAPDGGPGRIGGRGFNPALRDPHPYYRDGVRGQDRSGHPLPVVPIK
jgi:hypothetical protein